MSDAPVIDHAMHLSGEAESVPSKRRRTVAEKIQEAEARLQQLKAQEALKRKRDACRRRKVERRERLRAAVALTRDEDAHRKIQLGGVVIAAGMDGLDPAELCGLLLAARGALTPERRAALRETGLKHFAARKAAKGG